MLNPAFKFAALVLAAGSSSRFSGGHKLLETFSASLNSDQPSDALILSSMKPVIAAGFAQIIVVTGAQGDKIRQLIETGVPSNTDITFVKNENYALGMGGSIAKGMQAISHSIDGVFVFLADMPVLTGGVIDKLSSSFAAQSSAGINSGDDQFISICRPQFNGDAGHPVLFGRGHFKALQQLDGNTLSTDRGAKQIIDAHPDQLQLVEVDSPSVLIDIDTREDLARFKS